MLVIGFLEETQVSEKKKSRCRTSRPLARLFCASRTCATKLMTEKKWGPHEDRSKDWYSEHHAEPGFKKERAKRAKFDRQRRKDENIELNSRFSKLKVKARFLKAKLTGCSICPQARQISKAPR